MPSSTFAAIRNDVEPVIHSKKGALTSRGRIDHHQDLAKKQADVDPTISLAFTLDAHPGSYALLPGSQPTDQFSAKDWFAKGIGPNLGI